MTRHHFRALDPCRKPGRVYGSHVARAGVHGRDSMADLIHAKLASAVIERLIDGEETIDVMRLRITDAGRRFRRSGLPSVMRDAMPE